MALTRAVAAESRVQRWRRYQAVLLAEVAGLAETRGIVARSDLNRWE